jgi:hypothetical protein
VVKITNNIMNLCLSLLRILAVLLLTAVCLSAVVAADETPPWWQQNLRVERSESGLSLYRLQDGALLADQLEIVVPHEHFAIVWRKQKQGVVAADGSMLLPIEYDEIKPHDEAGLFLVKREALWGLLAYDGTIRAPIQYDNISDEDEPGVPWVVSQGEHRGLIDAASGQMLLGLEYGEIRVKPPFVLAAMESVAGSQDSLTWFALDLAGLPVPGVGPSSSLSVWDAAGLLVVNDQRVVDLAGIEVIPAGVFDSIRPIGQAAIVSKQGRHALIDRAGTLLTPLRYAQMWLLKAGEAGLIGVREADAQTGTLRIGVLDMQGQTIVEPRWDRLEHQVAQREGVEIPYYLVTLDGRTGSLNAHGETIFPARFDEAIRMDHGDPVYLVGENGLRGLCDFSLGQCPLPVIYSSLIPTDISPDDDLFIAELKGRYGIVSSANRIVVPIEFERIKTLTRMVLKPAEVEASKQFVVTRFRLERDDNRQWQSRVVPGSPIGEQDYDQHPVAVRSKPVLDARFLPEGIISDANVLAAAQAGRLREAVYPSIQISGHTAFVNFNLFVREGQSELAEMMMFCREGEGFRLLTRVNPDENPAGACSDDALDGLQFRADAEGAMVCEACEALALPTRWLRRDPPPRNECTLANMQVAGWTPASARAAYADWLERWHAELPMMLAEQAGAEGSTSREWDDRDASVLPHSRASSAVASMLLDPQRFAGLLEDPAAEIDWPALIRRFSALLETAEPMGAGGVYPEIDPQFAGICAEVWYMRLPPLETALTAGRTLPAFDGYALPPQGEFRRNAYPFLTFLRTTQGLQLAGVSRELLQSLLWLEAACTGADDEIANAACRELDGASSQGLGNK